MLLITLSSVVLLSDKGIYYSTFLILLMSKYLMRTLFFIFIALYFSAANALGNPIVSTSAGEVDALNLTAKDFLHQAKSIKKSNSKKSVLLANQALQLSKRNKNNLLIAQSHTFLAEQAYKLKNIPESKLHYMKASLIYQKLHDSIHQVELSLEYVELLYREKRYEDAKEIVERLKPIADKSKDGLSIARVLLSQGESYYRQKKYNDAIEKYTQALTSLTTDDPVVRKKRAETYKRIAESYKRLKNRKEIIFFYKKTLDLYTVLKDQKNMARTLNNLAEAERQVNRYEVALDYSIRSLAIHKKINDLDGKAKARVGIGIIYRNIGRYEKSLEYIYQAYQYYKKVNNANGIAKSSNQMGLVYSRLKQFDQARSFYQVTINLPEKEIDANELASALREMAVIYLNSGNYASAQSMAQKSYNIEKSRKNKINESVTTRIIANTYRYQEKMKEAIFYYKKSLKIAEETGSEILQIRALRPLGEVLIPTNPDDAISILKQALDLSIKIKSRKNRLYLYKALREVEKSRGNIAESLRYAEAEIKLTALIQKEAEVHELALVKAKLYSHKREMELQSLKEKAKFAELELSKKTNEIEIVEQSIKISELELTKNRYTTFILIILLAICFWLVIFISRRFIVSRKRNRELDYLANRDPLTNCYNRRILFDLLNRDFANLDLLDEYSLIMSDIDNFKEVNTEHGHSIGDAVLCGIADILQNGVRKSDIVVRYGGEEFCIILPTSNVEKAMSIAEDLRHTIESSRFEGVAVTCSFGITSIKYDATKPRDLIDQADLALYKSKNTGRNQVTLWDKAFKQDDNDVELI